MVSDTMHKRNATYCVAVDLQALGSYLGQKVQQFVREVRGASVDTCGRVRKAHHAILHTSSSAERKGIFAMCLSGTSFD